MMEKVIFHIDVNSAFLSWEAVYRMQILGDKTDLREIPSVVAGDIKKRHGIILAKSIPAKNYDIHTGDMISDAKQKCPDLVIADPHYDLYEANSRAFMEILRDFSPVVEQYSIDEAYCDMTEMQALYGSPIAAAYLLRDRIYTELGFTVNIGISTNKLLAKMASDFSKPNKVHTLFPEEVETKMWRLPVSDLFFVGRATTKKLRNLGIQTIGELAKTDVEILKSHLKKHGEVIHNFANGRDIDILMPEAPPNKGYGNSMTIAFDVEDELTAKMFLLSLSEKVCTRLRKDHVLATVVAVSIQYFDYSGSRHQMTLFTSTNTTTEIYQAACRAFDECWNGQPIRHIGIHTSKLSDDPSVRQLNLFDMNRYEKLIKMDRAVDCIRRRYGDDSVMRAAFLGTRIYHMSGGIAPEKRKPKYEGVTF